MILFSGSETQFTSNGIGRLSDAVTSVKSAQLAAISAGTFDDLYIGDYWTIGGVNWIVAGYTPCSMQIGIVPRW